MAVAVSVAVSMSVAVSVGPTLPAAAAAARAPSAGPPAVPGRHFISEPCHTVDTESQSSRSSGERDQCSAVVQPHITSHLDRNVSYARPGVGGGGGGCLAGFRTPSASAGEAAHPISSARLCQRPVVGVRKSNVMSVRLIGGRYLRP